MKRERKTFLTIGSGFNGWLQEAAKRQDQLAAEETEREAQERVGRLERELITARDTLERIERGKSDVGSTYSANALRNLARATLDSGRGK